MSFRLREDLNRRIILEFSGRFSGSYLGGGVRVVSSLRFRIGFFGGVGIRGGSGVGIEAFFLELSRLYIDIIVRLRKV